LNEGWLAYNQIEQWMPRWMNQMDIQLTWSEDGRNWHRAGNREPILACGPQGNFDSGTVYPPHAPVVVGDDIWIFYGGNNKLHGEPPRDGESERRGIGLAKIRKDRFVCLKSEGPGVVTTTPLGVQPEALWINADAGTGSVQVELLDPFDRVIPGCGREDCVLIEGDDTNHRVRWTGGGAASSKTTGGLEEKMVSQGRGGYKVRIYLDRAKLFAIYSDLS